MKYAVYHKTNAAPREAGVALEGYGAVWMKHAGIGGA